MCLDGGEVGNIHMNLRKLHGCSSKAQPLLFTLDEGYLLTTAPPDLEHGVAPLAVFHLRSHGSLDLGLVLPAAAPGLGRRVAPPGRHEQYERAK